MIEVKLHAEIEAERSIFNTILNDNAVLPGVAKVLSPVDFYQDNHQAIFRAMLDLAARGEPVDLPTLVSRLNDDLEAIGGAAYIAHLLNGEPPSPNITHHCQLVKKAAVQRQLVGLADQLWKTATSNADPADIGREAAEVYQGIKDKLSALDPQKSNRIQITGADLIERHFEDNPVIAGLLARRESLVIVGCSGIGKSVLTNHIGLIGGNPPVSGLFGQFQVPKPFTSYFVQSENTARAQKARLTKACKACPELRAGLQRMYFPFFSDDIRQTGILTDPDFEAMLLDDLAAVKPDALFLDPLISFHGEDENDNGAMRRTLDRLTLICDKADVACIVVHHVNKSVGKNDVFPGRGASAIGDWAANILVMSPVLDKNGDRTNVIEVRHHKARNYETKPTFFLERTSDLLLIPTGDPRDAQGFERLKIVYSVLNEMGGIVETKLALETEIAERTGKGRSTAQRMIKEAVDRGILVYMPGEGRREGIGIAHNAQNIMGRMETL